MDFILYLVAYGVFMVSVAQTVVSCHRNWNKGLLYHTTKARPNFVVVVGGEGKTSLSCLGERTSLCESFLLLGVQYSAQVGMVAGVGKCQNAFPVKQKYI